MSITGPATRYGSSVAVGRGFSDYVALGRRRLRATSIHKWTWLTCFGLLALVLRLPNYLSRDIWDDELIQYQISAASSLSEMFQTLVRLDRNPPGYALLARAALWFSDSDAMLRLPSLVAGIATVVLAWQAGKCWLDRQAAAIAAVLTAACPLYVFFSREARPYSVGLCAIYGYLICLQRFRMAPSLGRALLLGAVASGAVGVQYANVLVVGATLGIAAVYELATSNRSSRRLSLWGTAAVIPAAAVALNVWLFLVPQVTAHGTGKTDFLQPHFFDLSGLPAAGDFIPRSTAGFLGHLSLTEMTAANWRTAAIIGWLPLAAGALLAFHREPGVRQTEDGLPRPSSLERDGPGRPSCRDARLLAILTLTTLAAFLLAAGTGAHPFGAVRHALPLSPLIFLLYAAGLTALHRRRGCSRLAGWGAALLLLVQMGVADAEVLPCYHRFDYRCMKEYVDARRASNEVVLVAGYWVTAKYQHLSGSTETAQPPWYYVPISPMPDLAKLPAIKTLVDYSLAQSAGLWVIEIEDCLPYFDLGNQGLVSESHSMTGIRATHWTRAEKQPTPICGARPGESRRDICATNEIRGQPPD